VSRLLYVRVYAKRLDFRGCCSFVEIVPVPRSRRSGSYGCGDPYLARAAAGRRL